LSLVCENCGAVYKGKISSYSKFVRCPYCDSVIMVSPTSHKTDSAQKEFNIEQFRTFLSRRGVNTFDPVSGILQCGNQEVAVDADGAISGPEPLKSRAEKWLHIFMTKK